MYYIKYMNYNCECCNYTTNKRFNYDKHLITVKHNRIQERLMRQAVVIPQAPPIQPIATPPTPPAEKVAEFLCKHCNKKFAFKQSMYRHIKNSCTKKEELNEAAQGFKVTIEQLNHEIQKQNERLEDHQKQIEQLLTMSFQSDQVNAKQLQKDILEKINCLFQQLNKKD